MTDEGSSSLDIAVVGAGPAGMTACLELSKLSSLKIALFEGEEELGGMPRSCHLPFGMRDQKRIYTGPGYARRLARLTRQTSVEIHLEARVLDMTPGRSGEPHRLHVLSPEGHRSYESRFVILSTGCFESPISVRRIGGTRPSGIFTTGTLQQLVNLDHLTPGRRAIIVGSEHVALSSVLTLRRAGMSVVGLVEENPKLQTYVLPALWMSRYFKFPIHRNTSVKRILGHRRVEGVELLNAGDKRRRRVECDTVILTGRFRPDSMLIDGTAIEQDPASLGPMVDTNLMTSVPNIFAAGNLLRGADMHDLCALEGRLAARGIIDRLSTNEKGRGKDRFIRISARPPIRYVVPQKLNPDRVKKRLLSKLYPWPAIQLEKSLKDLVLEAWSGHERIWRGSYGKLIGNTRIPLPVETFDWDRVDMECGVVVKTHALNP